jgi:hypothetical protein
MVAGYDTGEVIVNHDVQQLVMDVMDGNPGALTIIQRLMSFSTWYPLLHHLKDQGLTGSALWRVVRDEYQEDWHRFASAQLRQMGLQDRPAAAMAFVPDWPSCN